MPGNPDRPTRPRRLISFSRERARYSCGGGPAATLLGLVFSAGGLLVLCACGWIVLAFIGIVPESNQNRSAGFADNLIGILATLVLGSCHLFCGSYLLWTLRVTLDRTRDLVTVRSGWLGL